MKDMCWRAIAQLVSRPAFAQWLITRAQRTPYEHIRSRDGSQIYMRRWWLANPYGKDAAGHELPARIKWLPSIRVHHICLPDDDQHEHDHPWDARTIVLRGGYIEERDTQGQPRRFVVVGDTHPITARQYHRIALVSTNGAYTLFFTWRFIEDWGFNVDGKKVPWREYLRMPADKGESA